MALLWGGCGSAGVLFDSNDDDIRFWRYVREQGEHSGVRDIGGSGDIGICTVGCAGNSICGIVYCGPFDDAQDRAGRRGGFLEFKVAFRRSWGVYILMCEKCERFEK
jgi:hypothetical protein